MIFYFLCFSTFAYDDDTLDINLSCDNTSLVSGEEFTLNLNFLPSDSLNVSAYRLKINFDCSKISYKGLYSYIGGDDFKSYINENVLTIIYITSENGFNINAKSSQAVLELNFKVLSDCEVGSTQINAAVDGLCDYDAEAIPLPEIEPVTVNIIQSGDGNCDLAALSAGEYKLVPNFSADITNYIVDVPYSKSTMEFETAPLDEDATVKANRKTLKSAGTPTDINLTVLSSDKKSKKVYTITVNRLSKENSNNLISKTLKNDKFYTDNMKNVGFYTDEDDEMSKANPDLNYDSEKDIAQKNNIELQNSSAPLVVKETSFNFILFFVCSAVFIIISIFILKHKKN